MFQERNLFLFRSLHFDTGLKCQYLRRMRGKNLSLTGRICEREAVFSLRFYLHVCLYVSARRYIIYIHMSPSSFSFSLLASHVTIVHLVFMWYSFYHVTTDNGLLRLTRSLLKRTSLKRCRRLSTNVDISPKKFWLQKRRDCLVNECCHELTCAKNKQNAMVLKNTRNAWSFW